MRAGVLGLTELDGLPVSPSEFILPCLSVLPMGWTWALRLCQAVTEQCVREEVGDHALIQDRRPGIVVGPSVLAGAAYVDNFGICGTNPTEVDSIEFQPVSLTWVSRFMNWNPPALAQPSSASRFPMGSYESSVLASGSSDAPWDVYCHATAVVEHSLRSCWVTQHGSCSYDGRASVSCTRATTSFKPATTVLHRYGAVCARSFRRSVPYCHC